MKGYIINVGSMAKNKTNFSFSEERITKKGIIQIKN